MSNCISLFVLNIIEGKETTLSFSLLFKGVLCVKNFKQKEVETKITINSNLNDILINHQKKYKFKGEIKYMEKYTVRIYNNNTQKKIDELAKKFQNQFTSKNDLITYLIAKGVEKTNSELGLSQEKSLTDLSMNYGELNSNFKSFKQEIGKHLFETNEQIKALQKVNSALYNLMLGYFFEEPINEKALESGLYDNLPDRIFAEVKDKPIV